MKPEQRHQRLKNALAESAPSLAIIYRWFSEVKRENTSLKDEEKEGRPRTALTNENVVKVKKLIDEDRHITFNQI